MTDVSSSPPDSRGEDDLEIRRDLLLVQAIRRMSQALDVHSRRMSAESRITLPQLLCLMAAVARDGITAREIAREIYLSPSTLVGVLDRLEGKNLIERVRDVEDRRRIHIRPTAAGREMVRALPSPFGAPFEAAFERLSVRRQKELIRAFSATAEMMEPVAEDSGG